MPDTAAPAFDLAPFDLGLMHDQGAPVPDLYDRLAEMRAIGDVVPVVWNAMPASLVTNYEAIREAFRDEELFSPRETRKVITPVSGERDISALEGSGTTPLLTFG